MAGGTTFHFINASLAEALEHVTMVANGKDMRVGDGPTVAGGYLKAGLVGYLHVAIAPILLGCGICLWDELRGLETNYSVTSETAPSGTIHITFQH
jgi:dihydrofolate reductase